MVRAIFLYFLKLEIGPKTGKSLRTRYIHVTVNDHHKRKILVLGVDLMCQRNEL